MRNLIAGLIAGVVALIAACEVENPVFIFDESARIELEGVFVGVEEITNGQDIGSNLGGGIDRGFSFPVVIQFFKDRRFVLTTANFPTSFDNEASRTCEGVFTTDGFNINFFSERLCRALPLTKFQVGRVIPFGINLEANTALVSNVATIRVNLRLNRE